MTTTKQAFLESAETTDRFQILSLDGGGIKGILSAAILAAIESDLGTSVTDHFDLIAGTSTGGIIAIALGLGLRPKDIVEFYVCEGPKIFPNLCGVGLLKHLLLRKYSAQPLEDALKRRFAERRFGESTKRLVIPSYSLGDDDVYIFRTPHLSRLRRDFKVPAWQVARATSAAPTYFPCARNVDKLRLIDGGVWANNPALVALTEVCGDRNLNIPLHAIRMLSIGTSNAIPHRRRFLDFGGRAAWGLSGTAVDIILRGQSKGVNNQIKLLLGDGHLERIDPNVPVGEFSLDGIGSANDLIAKAAHYSRMSMPNIEKKFGSHIAPPFNPIHQ